MHRSSSTRVVALMLCFKTSQTFIFSSITRCQSLASSLASAFELQHFVGTNIRDFGSATAKSENEGWDNQMHQKIKSIKEGKIDEETLMKLSGSVQTVQEIPREIQWKLREAAEQQAAENLAAAAAAEDGDSSPSLLVCAASSLAKISPNSRTLRQFMKTKVLPLVPKMSLNECFEAFHLSSRLELYSSGSNWMILNRIAQQLDFSISSDAIVQILAIFATMDSIHKIQQKSNILVDHKNLLKQCQDHFQQHVLTYETNNLITAFESLTTLQTLAPAVAFGELRNRVDQMSKEQLCRVLKLFVRGPLFFKNFVDEVIELVYDESIAVNAAIAYCICRYKLKERLPLLVSCLESLLGPSHVYPPDILVILTEVLQYIELNKLKLAGVRSIRPSANYLSQRRALYASIRPTPDDELLARLANEASSKYCFRTGVEIGPFRPSLVDTTNKIVVCLEPADKPTDGTLQRHFYNKWGFTRVGICSRYLYSVQGSASSLVQALISKALSRSNQRPQGTR